MSTVPEKDDRGKLGCPCDTLRFPDVPPNPKGLPISALYLSYLPSCSYYKFTVCLSVMKQSPLNRPECSIRLQT